MCAKKMRNFIVLEIRYLTFYDNISFFTLLGKNMENTFY